MGKWLDWLGFWTEKDVSNYKPIPEIEWLYEKGIYQKPFSQPGGYEGKQGEGSLRRQVKYLASIVFEKKPSDFSGLDFWWLSGNKSMAGFPGLLNRLEKLAVKKYKESQNLKIPASQLQKNISV